MSKSISDSAGVDLLAIALADIETAANGGIICANPSPSKQQHPYRCNLPETRAMTEEALIEAISPYLGKLGNITKAGIAKLKKKIVSSTDRREVTAWKRQLTKGMNRAIEDYERPMILSTPVTGSFLSALTQLHGLLAANEPAMEQQTVVPNNTTSFGKTKVSDNSSFISEMQRNQQAAEQAAKRTAEQPQASAATPPAGNASEGSARKKQVASGPTSKIDKESRDILRYISEDFVQYVGGKQECALRIESGDMISRAGFKPYCAKHYGDVLFIDSDGKEERVSAGDTWWTWNDPEKRVVRRVVMEPTSKPEHEDDPEVLNLWHMRKKGMAEPDMSATREDIKMFDDHLLMSAGGCEVTRDYVLDWLAFTYQFPDLKPMTLLAFVSPHEGTGKSWFAIPFKWVFGPELVGTTGVSALYEVYDTPFIDRRMVIFDETCDPTKVRQNADPGAKLRRMTTERETDMRPFGEKMKSMRTPVIVITCNQIDQLASFAEGRRLCVAYNPDPPCGAEYYDALFDWAGVLSPGPGIPKLAGYLATRDVSRFNANGTAPQSHAKVLAKEAALSKEAKLLKALYEEDHPVFARDFGRALHVSAQLENLCTPGMLRGLSLSPTNLPKVFKELGWKQIGVDGGYQTTNKSHRAWCWRDWEKWGDSTVKERHDYMLGAAPLTMHNGGLSQ
ncbi:hypothetical protein LG197_26160 [Pseudomonas asiatica]|uniref:hypothetical protein n=1 Tax=Pseudomonas asiatica TaxID=2219225 RepID=UPI002367679C|nr:hypothetical protein [Pseudomonas asiatica]WDM88037.1 hypothetical protein LG197_26160 [Pseudomonas asiatica]